MESRRSPNAKKGRGKGGELDLLSIPPQLQTALEALYGHYAKTFELWEKAGINVPPCFMWFVTIQLHQNWCTIISRGLIEKMMMVHLRL